MASPARTLALGTTEILEAILLRTDLKTVLFARRVCLKWKDIIMNSPSIQQHLFFGPISGTTPVVLNPLLSEVFPHFFVHPPLVVDEQARLSPGFGRSAALGLGSRMLNTFGYPRPNSNTAEEEASEEDPEIHPHFAPDDLNSLPLAQDSRNAAFLYEGASWRNMFPCQPPPYSALRLHLTDSMRGTRQYFSRVSEERIVSLDENGELAEGEKELGKTPPMRMETLFHLVTGGRGDRNGWVWIWGTLGAETPIPKEMGFTAINETLREVMKQAVQRDGLCIVQSSVMQCSPDGEPWRFDDKFLVKPRGSGWQGRVS